MDAGDPQGRDQAEALEAPVSRQEPEKPEAARGDDGIALGPGKPFIAERSDDANHASDRADVTDRTRL